MSGGSIIEMVLTSHGLDMCGDPSVYNDETTLYTLQSVVSNEESTTAEQIEWLRTLIPELIHVTRDDAEQILQEFRIHLLPTKEASTTPPPPPPPPPQTTTSASTGSNRNDRNMSSVPPQSYMLPVPPQSSSTISSLIERKLEEKKNKALTMVDNDVPTKAVVDIPTTQITTAMTISEDMRAVFMVHNMIESFETVDVQLIEYLMETIVLENVDAIALGAEVEGILLPFFPELETNESVTIQIVNIMTDALQERYQQQLQHRRAQIVRPTETQKELLSASDKQMVEEYNFEDVDDVVAREHLLNLSSMVPSIPKELVQHAFFHLCASNPLEAGPYLFDRMDGENLEKLVQNKKAHDKRLKEAAAIQAAENKRVKASIMKKFDGQYVTIGNDGKGSSSSSSSGAKDTSTPPPQPSVLGSNSKVRYLGGEVVSTKGGKVILIKNPHDDYDGGSRGKIYTKGKRGPGYHYG